jgi:hypothetical protein
MMIEDRMMRRRDPRDEPILGPEMTAVHADIAYTGLAINGNEGARRPNATAKPWFFDWRWQTRDTEILKRCPGVNNILDRRRCNCPRRMGLG